MLANIPDLMSLKMTDFGFEITSVDHHCQLFVYLSFIFLVSFFEIVFRMSVAHSTICQLTNCGHVPTLLCY